MGHVHLADRAKGAGMMNVYIESAFALFDDFSVYRNRIVVGFNEQGVVP